MGQEVLDAFWKSNDRIYNENTLLYHRLARACGLPDCAFWLLYTLRSEEAPLTQTQLSEQLSLPKQTVNSVISGMVKKGYVELEAIPGTKNKKIIRLTQAGDEYGRSVVLQINGAEQRAVGRMSKQERQACVELFAKYIMLVREELSKNH